MSATSPGFGTNIQARGSAAATKADPFADLGSFGKKQQPMNAHKASSPMGRGPTMGGGPMGGAPMGGGSMGATKQQPSPVHQKQQWTSPQHQARPNYSGTSKRDRYLNHITYFLDFL